MLVENEAGPTPQEIGQAIVAVRWQIENLKPKEALTLKRWAQAYTRLEAQFGEIGDEALSEMLRQEVPEASEVIVKVAKGIVRQSELRQKRSRLG